MKLESLTLFKKGILVEPHEGDETTAGGLILSGANDNNSLKKGYVKVISAEFEGIDKVRNSEHVLYSKYAGLDLRLEGKEYRLIKPEDIVFIKE